MKKTDLHYVSTKYSLLRTVSLFACKRCRGENNRIGSRRNRNDWIGINWCKKSLNENHLTANQIYFTFTSILSFAKRHQFIIFNLPRCERVFLSVFQPTDRRMILPHKIHLLIPIYRAQHDNTRRFFDHNYLSHSHNQ